MRKSLLAGAAVLLGITAVAQPNKGISKDMLDQIKKSYNANDPSTRAITNALTPVL